MTIALGGTRRHGSGEQGRAKVAKVDDRRPDFGKAHGRKVDLAGHLGEAARGDLVDLETGEALGFAVAFLRPLIDVIVSERTEIECSERMQRLAPGEAAARIDPCGTVRHRQRHAIINSAINLREGLPPEHVPIEVRKRTPRDTLLMIDAAQSLAGIRISCGDTYGPDVLRTRNILGARQGLKVEIGRAGSRNVELAGRVVDRGTVVFDDEGLAAAAALDRPEDVVKVRAVVAVLQIPVQRLVLEAGVKPVLGFQLVDGRNAEARIDLIELQWVFPMEEVTG